MGVDHGGTGWASPQNLEWGTLMPPRFCHIGTKRSVLWPSKYAKVRFRPGFCPRPYWGMPRRSPRRSSRLERGRTTRSPHPNPLGTDPPSVLAIRLPSIPARSIRLWV